MRNPFKNFGKHFVKGIKRKIDKIGDSRFGKGVKRKVQKIKKMAKDVENFADRAGFKNPVLSKEEQREFMRKNKGRTKAGMLLQAIGTGAKRGFQTVQAPAKAIAMMDPQRNTGAGKMGLSPISLLGDIAMAVPSSIGVIGQSIVDKDLRKKIKSGDSEAIQNLAFAPIALVTGGMLSGASKGLKGIGKGLVRGLSKLAR